MGWASASSIFDTVADGLIKSNASDEIKRNVLGAGHWVIRGVQGELYPIAEDVLAETYDPVDEG